MDQKIDRELGWDDTIVNDGEFEILPDGKYKFEVLKLERARYAGGTKLPPCNQANVTVVVSDDTGASKNIEEKFKLHSKMEWILCAFFRSIGLRKKDCSTGSKNIRSQPVSSAICYARIVAQVQRTSDHNYATPDMSTRTIVAQVQRTSDHNQDGECLFAGSIVAQVQRTSDHNYFTGAALI